VISLDKELDLYGARVGATEFNDTIKKLHAVMHPHWKGEELLYEPESARRYCAAVRAKCGDGLPDNVILRRLNNIRKKGRKRK
jgi:hypothetical protein